MIRIRVSALIIEGRKVLAIKHKKNSREYYLLPGGGVDFGETLDNALKREMKEELNVDIEVKDMVFISESISPDGKRHIISVVISCKLTSRNFIVGEEERLAGFEFLKIEELKSVTFYPDFKQQIIEFINSGKVNRKKISIKWKD